MIRFALRCDNDHRFESWFRSGPAFDALQSGGQVECPVCASRRVEKAPMAPAVSAGKAEAAAPSPDAASPEMVAAQAAYQESSKKSHFAEDMDAAWEAVKKVFRKSVECKFVAKRHGETILNVPVLVPIIGIFVWGATIWLLIIGLFFGMRYHIDGANPVTVDVNDAMGKAADAAESLKKDVTKND